MNEKFGVELELITSKFESKLDKLKNKINEFSDKSKSKIEPPEIVGTFIKNGKEINLVRKSEVELENSVENVGNEIENANSRFNDFGKNLKNTFNNGISNIKRFSLSLLGIRSIFSIISRASSQYLSQDTENANKLQAAWIGLGSLFAPLIDKIANFTIKAVSYINVFVKALTGVDYLTKAMTKSMDKLNKSSKATSKTLAGFDELTNINTDTSVSALDTSWVDSFNNIELNPSVISKLESMAKWLKENYKWLGLVIGSTALVSGILGLNSVLGSLATVGIITIGISLLYTALTGRELISDLKEVKNGLEGISKANEQNKNSAEKSAEGNDKLINSYKQLEQSTDITREKTDFYVDSLFRNIDTNELLTQKLEKQKTWLGYITGSNEEVTKSQQTYRDSTAKIIDELGRLYNQGTLNDEQTKLYISTIETQISTLESLKKQYGENSAEYKENEKQIKSLKSTLKDITGETYTINTELNAPATKNYENGLTRFFTRMNDKIASWSNSLSSWINNLFNGKKSNIPSYDVGTNYVPNDQLAVVHKGEAIIPAKYNNNSYFSSNDSTTNALLEELIDKVDNINFNPYVSIKDVGEASINYINKNKRIMGRSLVQ